MEKSISILGSTGSIGRQTLDLVAQNPDYYHVVALTAQNNLLLLIEQARRFLPQIVAIGNEEYLYDLKTALADLPIIVTGGNKAIIDAASWKADWVMAAITGAAGLAPTFAAIKQGADIALANKETLVCAGDLVLSAIQKAGGRLLPADSEHNAIFQAMQGNKASSMQRLILTASGGPFRNHGEEQLAHVTVEDALKHPTWQMGKKITIDSATLMNKGLELIEACYLFDVGQDRIDVVIHPESIIHSMVEFVDSSVIAQLGTPDMRVPISYCLHYPDRIACQAERLDWSQLRTLNFEPPDEQRFPALKLARTAMEQGQAACITLNAANEIAVDAFLEGRIQFLKIVQIVEKMLEEVENACLSRLEDVIELDQLTRARTMALLKGLS